MQDYKPISTPFFDFKLSFKMCPSNEVERKKMSQVSYAPVVESLMFVMICTNLTLHKRWERLVDV